MFYDYKTVCESNVSFLKNKPIISGQTQLYIYTHTHTHNSVFLYQVFGCVFQLTLGCILKIKI
jgi:hypothetical protein